MLVKRMKKENLIIMRTDKSGKLCVTSEEKYLEMGKEHVEADKVINREKIRETDKVMNEHSAAWCSIWRTGTNHEHQDRVVQSKTSKSENRAKLYLAYKDHKKERHKTRPIGTACSSNTRAFANSVSELLESVANCETKKFEVILVSFLMTPLQMWTCQHLPLIALILWLVHDIVCQIQFLFSAGRMYCSPNN